MKAYGMPMAGLLIWPARIVELAAGAVLPVGCKARGESPALALFTIPATLIFHAHGGMPADQALNRQIHFMKNLVIVGGLPGEFARDSGRIALAC